MSICRKAVLFAFSLFMMALVATAHPDAAQASQPPWGEAGISRGEDLSIQLVTFEPGDDIPSWFGHTALVVEDTRLRTSRLYNYGMFSFDSAMLAKFAMGRLEFWVGDSHVKRTYDFYASMNRGVRIQELNISPEKRVEIARFLANNVLPENRDYLYHHYDDNCATRIRDVIDLATDGQFAKAAEAPARFTLREHTRRHARHNPLMDALLMFLMNNEIDQPITNREEMFLPAELEMSVDKFEYTDAAGNRIPLVANRTVYATSTRAPIPEEPSLLWPFALALGLLAGGIAATLGHFQKRRLLGLYTALIGLFPGIPGLVLALMGTFTDHSVTYWNQNVLLANPLTFLMLPLGLMYAFGSERATRWLPNLWLLLAATSLLALLLFGVGQFVPVLYQDTSIPLSFLLPLNLGFAAAFGEKYVSRERHACPPIPIQ